MCVCDVCVCVCAKMERERGHACLRGLEDIVVS